MNARLEPRMVAARIQGPACALHGLPSPPDRIMASSHGGFMQAADAVVYCRDSLDHAVLTENCIRSRKSCYWPPKSYQWAFHPSKKDLQLQSKRAFARCRRR